jgi:hypothetical protein
MAPQEPITDAGTFAIGPQDVAFDGAGNVWAIVGLGANPISASLVFSPSVYDWGFGQLVMSDGAGGWMSMDDIAQYEVDNNPDGGLIDSNPFSLDYDADTDAWAVADAGANAQLRVHSGGAIETLAVFPDIMVTDPFSPANMIPMQAVPTGLEETADGYYQGQLTGFPFPVGAASVWHVSDGMTVTEAYTGFTNILDVAEGDDGSLYVVQMTKVGFLFVDPSDPASLNGRIVKIAPDGTQTIVLDAGLTLPTGIAYQDGSLYISDNGIFPNWPPPAPSGQVVRISLVPTGVGVSGLGASSANLLLMPAALFGAVLLGLGLFLWRRGRTEQIAA